MPFFGNHAPAAKIQTQRSEPLRAEELRNELLRRGYRYCTPKATTWRSALIARHGASVLCVLFRKNGVDIRHYQEYKGEVSIDASNVASFVGGELFRNHYKGSVRIHRHVLFVASEFMKGTLKRDQLPGRQVLLASGQANTQVQLGTMRLPGEDQHFLASR